MQGANGQKAIDNGAAINMHLAANLFVLCHTGAASESTLCAETPSRNTFRPPSGGSRADFSPSPKQGSKEDVADGTNAIQTHHYHKSLACDVDRAARASVVTTELGNVPMVDLVAGVLDAEATRLREQETEDIVKTKLKQQA